MKLLHHLIVSSTSHVLKYGDSVVSSWEGVGGGGGGIFFFNMGSSNLFAIETGFGGRRTSYYVGSENSFPGVSRSERQVDHLHPFYPKDKNALSFASTALTSPNSVVFKRRDDFTISAKCVARNKG
jgi:hypothetical protein